ncbi:hypothetical protein OE88DRAFT_1655506 [Heliocybe sulcata]|uniref:C2H2-type domain-containing protein n=1 Tax=Heliocybe sulcata TaxID=5364 RepID=A0A5C3N6S6_9AGAM|nr:hypothetical protein OE88DRAFT_1655506 [Heliocybe sulcata]
MPEPLWPSLALSPSPSTTGSASLDSTPSLVPDSLEPNLLAASSSTESYDGDTLLSPSAPIDGQLDAWVQSEQQAAWDEIFSSFIASPSSAAGSSSQSYNDDNLFWSNNPAMDSYQLSPIAGPSTLLDTAQPSKPSVSATAWDLDFSSSCTAPQPSASERRQGLLDCSSALYAFSVLGTCDPKPPSPPPPCIDPRLLMLNGQPSASPRISPSPSPERETSPLLWHQMSSSSLLWPMPSQSSLGPENSQSYVRSTKTTSSKRKRTEDNEESFPPDNVRAETMAERRPTKCRRVDEAPMPHASPNQNVIKDGASSILGFRRSTRQCGGPRPDYRELLMDNHLATSSKSSLAKEKRTANAKANRAASNRTSAYSNPNNKCEVCGRVFTRIQDLNRHKISVHENRAYPCQYCGKVLSREDSKIRHEKECKKKPRDRQGDGQQEEE